MFDRPLAVPTNARIARLMCSGIGVPHRLALLVDGQKSVALSVSVPENEWRSPRIFCSLQSA